MRRCLSILLLVFMPLQFSWAAVGTYCEHESGTRAQHFGHHEHKHEHKQRQAAGESVEASKGKLAGVLAGALAGAVDLADCHFHCQCTVDLPSVLVMPIVIGSQAPTDWTVADAIAPVLSRPERPQWVDHA